MAKMKSWHVYRECEKYLCEICVGNSRWALDNNFNALLSAVKGNCWCWWPFREAVLGLWCVSNKRTLSFHELHFYFPSSPQSLVPGRLRPPSEWGKLGGYNLIQSFHVRTAGRAGIPPSPSSCKGGDSTFSEQLQLVLPLFPGQELAIKFSASGFCVAAYVVKQAL